MFFGRVVVFEENLLSSQMGVVSAIRRSSRSADRRRKTQETYGLYAELSIRLQACLVLCCCSLLVVSRSPLRWNVDKASFGASGAPHHITWGGKRGSPCCSFLTRNSHRPVPGRGGRVHPGCQDALQLRGYIDDRLQGSL